MLEALRALSDTERAEKSAAIAAHLRNVGGIVFGFAPMRLEPDWTTAIAANWTLALPRIAGDRLEFHRVNDLATLAKGRMGTCEPLLSDEIPPTRVDVILTPGLAFDLTGARLGRGGGFYDRLLAVAARRARRIAVCFACQIADRIPVEPHDARVDAIVTEDGWLEVRNSARDPD